jgi:hypothetical protein
MASDPREAQVVRTLRVIIAITVVLGVLAVALGSGFFAVFAIAFYAPAAWVYWRPRWGQIVIWIMWTTTLAMIPVFRVLDRLDTLRVAPGYLMGIVLVLIVCVMPLVRVMNKPPRIPREVKIPVARVVRR